MEEKNQTSRDLKAIETKNRIYECALQLIEEKGFDRVSISEIASAAGVSVGLFYYYFPSKKAVLNEIYKRADHYFQHDIARDFEGRGSLEKISIYIRTYISFVESDGIDLIRNLYIPTNTFFIEEGRSMQLVLAELIRQGQEAGDISAMRDPQQWVLFIFTVLRGIVFDWCLYGGGYDLHEKTTPYIEMITSFLKN